MRVDAISEANMVYNASYPLAIVTANLQALAARQSVSVDDMISSAKNASDPTDTQMRIINLADRLNSLRG